MQIDLEVNKINKNKIIERRWKDKNGNEHVDKIYKVRIVNNKEPVVLATGEGWVLKKIGFCVEKKDSMEEPDNYVGNVVEFEKTSVDGLSGKEEHLAKKEFAQKAAEGVKEFDSMTSDGEIDVNDIPF